MPNYRLTDPKARRRWTRRRLWNEWKFTALGVLVLIVFVLGIIWQITQWNDCSAQGGEYVRTMSGQYKCVQVVEP